MSHGITEFDLLLSTRDTSWHGLSKVVQVIDDEAVEPLMFKIHEGRTLVEIDGQTVVIPNRKALVADLRARLDLLEEFRQLLPLHTPSSKYKVISNRDIWEAAKAALKDTGAEISSIGTLEACNKFFISATINGLTSKINNEDFLNEFNILSSHDGTTELEFFDCNTRVVCMNTFRWALDAKGKCKATIAHTKNAEIALTNIPQVINSILLGRESLKAELEMMAETGLTKDEAQYYALAYFVKNDENLEKVSTRAFNGAQEIRRLFGTDGTGNQGKTAYDLFNGATEYWTSGQGTGMDSDAKTRAYKSEYGQAAQHKREFKEFIMAGVNSEEFKGKTLDKGRKAYSVYMAAN